MGFGRVLWTHVLQNKRAGIFLQIWRHKNCPVLLGTTSRCPSTKCPLRWAWPLVVLSLISELWEQKTLSRGVQNPHKYSWAGIMLKCKTPKQMRLENSPGRLLNFAVVINQEYCHVSPYRTWTNCFFKHLSGRHKSVFMVTTGRCKGRLANMKIKSSLGCHLAMLGCVKS